MTHSQLFILELIKKSGKTGSALSKNAGIPRQRFQEWKNGSHKPSLENCILLCEKNNLKISDILSVM